MPTPHLTLVRGQQLPEDGLESFAPGRALRRPGDRHEPLSVEGDRERLLDAADDRSLDHEVAISLVLERRLAIRDLSGHGRELVIILDRRAEMSQAHQPIWSANADYARSLLMKGSVGPSSGPGPIPVPTRLWERLARAALSVDDGSADELDAAIAWEVAAVGEGLTMSEWAYRSALDLIKLA